MKARFLRCKPHPDGFDAEFFRQDNKKWYVNKFKQSKCKHLSPMSSKVALLLKNKAKTDAEKLAKVSEMMEPRPHKVFLNVGLIRFTSFCFIC